MIIGHIIAKGQRIKFKINDGEDGWLVAECPELKGCVSQGKTREETIDNIREAASLYLETIQAGGIT